MVRTGWVLLGLAGCYTPPDLPLLDRVPIEGPDFIACADDVEDARVDCVVDGATFDISTCGAGDEVRYRLLGTATPVSGDCYADSAREWLEGILVSEDVTLTFDSVCVDEDGTQMVYAWARGDLYEDLARDRRIEDLTRDYGNDEPAVLINEVALRLGILRTREEEIPGGAYLSGDFSAAATAAEADRLGLYLACGAEG